MVAQNSRRCLVALVCTTLVVFSTFAAFPAAAVVTSGGTATVAEAGNAPGVHVPDTELDSSSDSHVEVAYNATGVGVPTDDLEVYLFLNGTNTMVAWNTSLSTEAGVANVTVPQDALGEDTRIDAQLFDNGTFTELAVDTAAFTVTGGGGGGGLGLPAAPYVNASDDVLDPSVQTTVQVTYNATGQVATPGDVNVSIRNESSGEFIGYNNTLLSTEGFANVTVPAGEGTVPFSATIFLNNSSTGMPMATDVANYTPSDGGGGGGGGSGSVNITGYVTDASGTPIQNANVVAYGPSSLTQTTTNASGGYTVSGEAGFYGLEFNASGTGTTTKFVELQDGQNKTVNATLHPPGYIAGQVVDESGTPVAGATVSAWGPGTATVTTDAQGRYNATVSAGTYFVEVSSSTHPRVSYRGVSVTTGETTTQDAALSDPGYITGRIVNKTGVGVSQAWVMVDSGDQMAFGQTNATGYLNISVVPGTYRMTAFGMQGGMASHGSDITVTTGSTEDLGTIQMVNPQILSSDIRHVGGTAPDMSNVSVNTFSMGGMLNIMVENTSSPSPGGGMPSNLSTVGVDNTTVFEINLTVTDFDPNALLWGARDVTWSATQNQSNPSATDITVRTKAVHLAGINDQVAGKDLPVGPMGLSGMSPDDFKWPSGAKDKADLEWENTVYFLLYDLSNVPPSVSQNLDNMTVVTNAQTFSRPRMVNDTLKVYVAGPHYRMDGTVHDGFYSAFIPDAQLDEWGVSDPATELAAKYQGNPQDFNVEVTGDGAWIHLDIHYSDGYTEIAPASSGGNGGSTSSSSTTTATDDSDSGETSISVGASKTNADGSQTASASVKNAKANATVSLSFDDGSEDADDADESDADAALEALNVSLSDDADFDVEVSTTIDAPEAASTPTPDTSTVVSYVQIDHDGLEDDQISAAALTMRVKKDRFGDDFDPANAVVYRLHDGDWTELETTLIGETPSHYRFRADSPGLSVFAIGEKQPVLSRTLSLSTTTAAVGEDVTVDVTITNDGTGQGTYTATLAANGATVVTKTVTVPAGEAVTVSLAWEFGTGGDYVLSVNGEDAGTVTVASIDRTTTTTTTAGTTPNTATTQPPTTAAESPGFGIIAGLLALLVAARIARD